MARMHDSEGVLLGGLSTANFGPLESAPDLTPMSALPSLTDRPPIGAAETAPSLECQYEFSRADRADGRCRVSIAAPDERHRCDRCGGYYCAAHAEPAAHGCRAVH